MQGIFNNNKGSLGKIFGQSEMVANQKCPDVLEAVQFTDKFMAVVVCFPTMAIKSVPLLPLGVRLSVATELISRLGSPSSLALRICAICPVV
jgi:hypothetical protein